jgi:hypothetical protein
VLSISPDVCIFQAGTAFEVPDVPRAPEAQRRVSHYPKRYVCSSPSSTAGPGTATPVNNQ